ncbi:UDP-N-acetylglucosamine 2-epimerase (non-hydrolyzing) [Clostridium sp. 'deep sea']|uniref:non-hydrolyzing UDP-N-acetylglucosamine 2-epimerase n=1 Tax=Clostridium sp. 'deep sea' TaxID=2779445 RepID=UPI001896A1F6|nr:UDP-N-acetylglucosamine 2-epimerase (non-hydrolyzing) [Clostridium sp. 'deep sea']QOR33786.1 UDP-N-acetylglucosamine 2-epimerase (non-hydrolyzing) [Clostridium sp. 'deep sea']
MNKIKVMSVFGVRPEAIKMAPVIKELEKYPNEIESIVTVTGQHREMLHQILNLFKIKPDYDLNIMKEKQTLTDIIERSLRGLEKVYQEVKPNLVLVHGDPSTSFIAALAAFYQKIPIGHVEAGLRTYNKYFPFPEEVNRRLTGVLADLHFAPTTDSKQNLLNEGVPEDKIFVTGNTAIDALNYTVNEKHQFRDKQLANKPWQGKRLIVMEIHRRENWGAPIQQICEAIKQIVTEFSEVYLVASVHLNPIVRDDIFKILSGVDRVLLTNPLDVDDYQNLFSQAIMLLSDSGGVQEEAPAMGVPMLLTRNVTERPEAIKAGTVILAGNTKEGVYNAVKELLINEQKRQAMARSVNPYGDGRSSERIVKIILNHFAHKDIAIDEWKYHEL